MAQVKALNPKRNPLWDLPRVSNTFKASVATSEVPHDNLAASRSAAIAARRAELHKGTVVTRS